MVAKAAYWLAFDAVLLAHHVVGHPLVLADAARGVEHAHLGLVVDELEQVAVAGDDVDRHPGVGRQRADHVVRLVVVGPDDRDAERLQRRDDDRDLLLERVRDLLDVRRVAGPGTTTRCALYDGSRSTRHCGRQSLSQQQTRWVGSYSSTSRLMKSSSPRTALTGVPSGAWTESGTPKNARK